jgi:hypothetical protein
MPALPFRLPALALAAALPLGAAAHQAPTGWSYDAWCCGGLDCQPIPSEQVDVTEEGFVVTIPAESHANASHDQRRLFRYDEVRHSGDQNYHACIIPYSQEFRCLYVPSFGY